MKILKASAGSGKTHRLSETYLDLLMNSDDRFAYRHILAVTFTNKATAEMKDRILKKLLERSSTDERAKRMLVDILHDYGAFSVSTIDSFFQKTLKSFAREIGQHADYQVELDQNSLIREAVDSILDGLTEDQVELLDWIRSNAMAELQDGKSFKIDEGLYDIGDKLKKDVLRDLTERNGVDLSKNWDRARLEEIRKSCRSVINEFKDLMEQIGKPVEPGTIQKHKVRGIPTDLRDRYEELYPLYVTASHIEKTLYKLGLAGEFYRAFEDLVREKGVMTLDDSKSVLRDIIDGSDAPFIYEKIGVKYDHFLLDEFQDTARIEWADFLPLLRESESRSEPDNVSSLIVGDVKQSIYRWRNSDWRLLGHEVAEEFPDADIETLDSNWRSLPGIIDFNNKFFMFAENIVHTGMYGDVRQKAEQTSEGGFVRISFTDDQLEAVYGSVCSAKEAGARYGDMAILVRYNSDGQTIATDLISRGVPVISDDSLLIKSSQMVKTLVSMLQYINDPNDRQGAYLATRTGVDIPSTYHSLVSLVEELGRQLRDRDPESFERESAFVSAFMDEVRQWADVHGNDLMPFLDDWLNRKNPPTISSPEKTDAVRVLTIHKSKGLEFPFVIFPFVESIERYKHGEHWCRLDSKGTGLDSMDGTILPVTLSNQVERSLFAGQLESEHTMQDVDNLNLIYVAFTRAVNGMQIIGSLPETFIRDFRPGACELKNYAQILYEFCEGKDYSAGEFDLGHIRRKDERDAPEAFPAGYPSFPLGGRLTASSDAFDFFDGEETGSRRLKGIDLHKAMEGVRTSTDLPRDLAPEDYELLSGRIASHPEWFGTATVRNEVSIIGTDGESHRPDRVIIDGGDVTVIDYKFGAKLPEKHRSQVREYMDLYRRMGYENVTGFVWYVIDDEIISA